MEIIRPPLKVEREREFKRTFSLSLFALLFLAAIINRQRTHNPLLPVPDVQSSPRFPCARTLWQKLFVRLLINRSALDFGVGWSISMCYMAGASQSKWRV